MGFGQGFNRTRVGFKRGFTNLRSESGSGGSGALQMTALQGWNGTARYEETNAGPPGSTTMSRMIVFVPTSVPVVFNGMAQVGGFSGVARGWAMDVTSAAVIRGVIANSTPAFAISPPYTIVTGDVGKVIVWFFTYNGSSVRAFQQTNGVVAEIGVGTVATGYTTATATDDYLVGNARSTFDRPAVNLRIVSMAGSDTDAWDLTEMQAIADDIRANFKISTAVPGENHRYNAVDALAPGGNWVAASGTNLVPLGVDPNLINKITFTPTFR